MIFTVSAAIGGVVVFGGLGCLAYIQLTRTAWTLAAAMLALRAGWWHWRNLQRFAFDRDQAQARRNLAGRDWLGTAYFGWILGVTVVTQMTTPLVQALGILAAALGLPFGIAAGIGLGLARSMAPWAGAMTQGGSMPAMVVRRYARRSGAFRLIGIATAAIMLALDITWWLRK